MPRDESDPRRIDPQTGEVYEKLELPHGVKVSDLESNGSVQFLSGGGKTGKIRIVCVGLDEVRPELIEFFALLYK